MDHAALCKRKRDRRGWVATLCALVALACQLYPSMLGTYGSEHYQRTVRWGDQHHGQVVPKLPFHGGYVIGQAAQLGADILLGA